MKVYVLVKLKKHLEAFGKPDADGLYGDVREVKFMEPVEVTDSKEWAEDWNKEDPKTQGFKEFDLMEGERWSEYFGKWMKNEKKYTTGNS